MSVSTQSAPFLPADSDTLSSTTGTKSSTAKTTTTTTTILLDEAASPKKRNKMLSLSRTFSAVRRGLSSRPPSPQLPSPAASPELRPNNVLSKRKLHQQSPVTQPASPNDKYILQVFEAFAPKGRPNAPMQQVKLSKYTTTNGHTRPDSGEDAFFSIQLSKGENKGALALGVADGVGGWAHIGVDPALYSYTLCHNMEQKFGEQEELKSGSGTSIPSPLSLIEHSYDKIKSEKQVEAGSSTACVGVISPVDGVLNVANLGDSGYLIFREGRLYRQSKPQTHIFNTPYQMAVIPPTLKVRNAQRIDDKPSDAEISSHELQHGDVVVLATDGLMDNMFVHEMLSIVKEHMLRAGSWKQENDEVIRPGQLMLGGNELSSALVRQAALWSLDPHRNSPFTQDLRRTLTVDPMQIWGGKYDDITALVLLVQNVPVPQTPESIETENDGPEYVTTTELPPPAKNTDEPLDSPKLMPRDATAKRL